MIIKTPFPFVKIKIYKRKGGFYLANYPNYYMVNPYMTNPMINQQNRLQSMENQFYGSQQQIQQNNNLILKGRPVTSFDEAKASMIDLDGSVFIFPDYASGKIYTKQINMDGTASIRTYELVNPMNVQQNVQNSGEVENELKNKINLLENKITKLESEVNSYVQSITGFIPAIKSSESTSNDVANVSGKSSNGKSYGND